MEEMFRLDFSSGTVEKIDANVPPRGWRGSIPQDEEPPDRTGYSFGAPGTTPREKPDEQ